MKYAHTKSNPIHGIVFTEKMYLRSVIVSSTQLHIDGTPDYKYEFWFFFFFFLSHNIIPKRIT